MKKKQAYKRITVVLILLFGVVFAKPSLAAEFVVSGESVLLRPGGLLEVRVNINAQKQDINALSGILRYDNQQMELQEIRDASSVVSLWVQRPELNRGGLVPFSGIIPGGYSEDGALVFSALFKVKSRYGSSGSVEILEPKALLDDGFGTETQVVNTAFAYEVSSGSTRILALEKIYDSFAPEKFTPIIGSSPDIFNGKYFLSFATQDRQSGMDHFEIKEGIWGRWVVAKSPYLLQKQDLNSQIIVKAYDKQGNVRTVIVGAKHPVKWYANIYIYGIILLVVLVVLVRNKKQK